MLNIPKIVFILFIFSIKIKQSLSNCPCKYGAHCFGRLNHHSIETVCGCTLRIQDSNATKICDSTYKVNFRGHRQMMKRKCRDQIPYCASESQCDGSPPDENTLRCCKRNDDRYCGPGYAKVDAEGNCICVCPEDHEGETCGIKIFASIVESENVYDGFLF